MPVDSVYYWTDSASIISSSSSLPSFHLPTFLNVLIKSLNYFFLKNCRKGRDAVKLTVRPIITSKQRERFKLNNLGFHFGNFEDRLILFKSRAKSFYYYRTNFQVRIQNNYSGIIGFRKFDVGIR